jgi:arylformamidase
VVFFHGGYWQELSKTDSRFAAWDCIQRGWAFAAVDYTLAPDALLPEIIDECRRATRTLHREAATLEFDPTRIFVAGSSAGAHLAAMACTDPQGPADAIRGAVLVSGIFELEPLIGTSINDAVQLDRRTAARNSPLHADLTGFPPTLVVYGTDETSEFKAQSNTFAAKLRADGASASTLEIPERNHFDVIVDLAKPNTTLGDTVAGLIDTHGGAHADL